MKQDTVIVTAGGSAMLAPGDGRNMAGHGRNMAGLTEAEIRQRLQERGVCAAVTAACAAALALIALAALACWACRGCAADRAVAAYSVCESCGRMLDGAVVACLEEGEAHE